ncbi:MAG TPA: hypothetical protein VGJ32_16560 [Solirubrobacteraceae bacterium]|jgi:hypothetical protein
MPDELRERDIEVLSAGDPADPFTVEDGVVGGSAVPEPLDEEHTTQVVDGSLAGRLRAVGEKLQRTSTRDFPIVVRDEDDEPFATLVLRAKAFRDRKAFQRGVKTEAFIVRATVGLFLRDEDTDELLPIPTWGSELAGMLGFTQVQSASELVQRVLDNPVRLETFAADLIRWMAGRSQEDEQALGE